MSDRAEPSSNTARPGDICIILEPTKHELLKMRQVQARLQARFGGRVFDPVHVTCQRFAVEDADLLPTVLRSHREDLSTVQPFQLLAASLALVYSPFWGSHVLKWIVQPTASWRAFRSVIEDTLTALGCSPHYPPEQETTCTALVQVPLVEAEDHAATISFPYPLFGARRIVLSKIVRPGQFDIVDTFELSAVEQSATRYPSQERRDVL